MASTSDGWPQFVKTFDEWRERKAQEGGGRGFSGGWMDARTGQGDNSNGLRSSARSGGRPMTVRFNPPPGSPAVPDGWTPPPGWQPDPTWPAPSTGWQLWVDETRTSPHRVMDSAWAIAGGTAVFLGSLLPFVTFSDPEIGVNPGARAASALFGLIVLGLGIALRAARRRFLLGRIACDLVPVRPGSPRSRDHHRGRAGRRIRAGSARVFHEDHVLHRHWNPPRARWLRGRRRRKHRVYSAPQVLIMRRHLGPGRP